MQPVLPVLVIFFGSFLLFGIQPMLGRTLLPSFGGTAAVWTVCLAAYQVLLLAGYGYAHVIAGKGARAQRRLHLALLAASVLWTFAFAALRLNLKDRLGTFPVPSLEVLFCVLVFVGLPYVLLSANSSLIQAWLAAGSVRDSGLPSTGVGDECAATDAQRGRGVYRLYAVSNLGSLLGLLAYPFLLEPFVPLNAQWYGFSGCMLAYTALLAVVAKRTVPQVGESHGSRSGSCEPPTSDCRLPTADCGLPPPLTRPWLWFALPALSTFLLNAVTVHLSTDVTPMPLMWVLLLTAFLLSYVLGFSVVGEKGLIAWAALAVVTLLAAAGISLRQGGTAFLPNLLAGTGLMLVAGTFLHGWLYRIRPDAERLTRFYLGMAAGGAMGGVSASLVAPALFTHVWEYPLALAAVAAACAWLVRTWDHPELKGLNRILLGAAAAAALLTGAFALKGERRCLDARRNFYGCLRVTREEMRSNALGTVMPFNAFHHGETVHGYQMQDAGLKPLPTAYFGLPGGGIAFHRHPSYTNGTPMRVGVIGLGAGTLACYGRTNDVYRFYEINPQVVEVASDTNLFTFLADCPAKVEIALGDARKTLLAEKAADAPRYDILVVDAFTGDSVPFHLATLEAFRLYLDRLKPDGILALHVSNWHIDLRPLCKAMARELNLNASGIVSLPKGVCLECLWVMMSREPRDFSWEYTRQLNWEQIRDIPTPRDECGSLLPLIRFARPPTKKDAGAFDMR